MKRRSVQPKKLRSRRSGLSPYRRHQKREHSYSFPTGEDAHKLRTPEERDRWLRSRFEDARLIMARIHTGKA